MPCVRVWLKRESAGALEKTEPCFSHRKIKLRIAKSPDSARVGSGQLVQGQLIEGQLVERTGQLVIGQFAERQTGRKGQPVEWQLVEFREEALR